MDGISCDRCGKGLLIDEDVRYLVRIEVKAAYDPLELTREDLDKDLRGEMKRLMEEAKKKPKGELENEVYKSFAFDLCPPCQRAYLKSPLPKDQDRRDNFENPA